MSVARVLGALFQVVERTLNLVFGGEWERFHFVSCSTKKLCWNDVFSQTVTRVRGNVCIHLSRTNLLFMCAEYGKRCKKKCCGLVVLNCGCNSLNILLLVTYALLISVNWLAWSYFLSVLRIGALSHHFCLVAWNCDYCLWWGKHLTIHCCWGPNPTHTKKNKAPFIVFVFTRSKEPTLPHCCHHEVQGTSTLWVPLFTSAFQQCWCSVIEVFHLPFFLPDLHRHHTGLFF